MCLTTQIIAHKKEEGPEKRKRKKNTFNNKPIPLERVRTKTKRNQ